jgi:MraZ protein
LVAASFTGEERVRIDGKGRMSIPAKFRDVLQAGDPGWREGSGTALQLVYGDNLGRRLEARTLGNHAAIAERITAWEPVSDEEEAEKQAAEYFMLTQSQPVEVDRDGRIVMPARFRDRLGLREGEVALAGKGDRFEIWAADTYDAEVAGPMRAFLASKPPNYNPMTALARAKRG